MLRVVLETNVIVSGVLRPASVPASVLQLIHEKRIRPVVDDRILDEYTEVLARPRLKIPAEVATELLTHLAGIAEHVTVFPDAVSRPDRLALPDPDDRPQSLGEVSVERG